MTTTQKQTKSAMVFFIITGIFCLIPREIPVFVHLVKPKLGLMILIVEVSKNIDVVNMSPLS